MISDFSTVLDVFASEELSSRVITAKGPYFFVYICRFLFVFSSIGNAGR